MLPQLQYLEHMISQEGISLIQKNYTQYTIIHFQTTSKDYKDSWASSISIEDDEDNQNLSTTSRIHEERK